jgi:hypothetical protein
MNMAFLKPEEARWLLSKLWREKPVTTPPMRAAV